MTDTSSETTGDPTMDAHADKYNDPRAKVTPRGLLLVGIVIVLGIIGAAGSIYARRTRLEKTTEFWGPEAIMAMQLGERIRMFSISGESFDPVELTRTPGLGHLRRLLLDERNYDWSSVSQTSVDQRCGGDATFCIQLKISDPTAKRFDPVAMTVELNSGWIGRSEGDRSVQVAERKRNALRKFLKQLITVRQQRYDHRE